MEQSIRKKKSGERERQKRDDEGEDSVRDTLERASMRECAAQWLLIAFKSASCWLPLSSLSLSLAFSFVRSSVPSFNLGHVSDDFQTRT